MTAAKTLLIVYHSHTGGTRQMVDAVCAGAVAADSGVEVRLLAAPQAQAADVLAADGYLFATAPAQTASTICRVPPVCEW